MQSLSRDWSRLAKGRSGCRGGLATDRLEVRKVMTIQKYQNESGQPIGAPMANWVGRPRPPHTPMTGRYCRVEPLRPDAHGEHLYQAYTADVNRQNWTYLPYGPFASCDDFVAWLKTDCIHADPLFHTIVDLATELPVGLASYLRIEPSSGVIEVGHIHYSPRLQRTSAATEVMFLMMSRVFDELGYRRYEWKCDALNEPSRHAAMRLGFSFEGIFRQATIYKGRSRDTAWYSILDQEWPPLKQAYQEWLSPDNHDSQGKQKRQLECIIGATR